MNNIMGLLRCIISIVVAIYIYRSYQNRATIEQIPRVGRLLSRLDPYLVIIIALIVLHLLL